MFDCHCHTQFEAFKDDWKATIGRAQAAGVSIINVGTQRDTSAKAVEIAHQYEKGVYASVGVHPIHTSQSHHDEAELGGGEAAKAFNSRGEKFDYEFYLNLARDPKVVALGECGLDYYRVTDNSQLTTDNWKQKQKEVFSQHVKIAQETGKALMIHCRPSKGTDDAYEDLLDLITNYNLPITFPKILHFYVGSVAMTQKFLEDRKSVV